MSKIDGRAYLHWIRNVHPGLISRTKIIDMLYEEEWKSINEIARNIDLTENTVRYHLKNMLKERIVEKQSDGPGWRLGEIGQTLLTDFMKKKKK